MNEVHRLGSVLGPVQLRSQTISDVQKRAERLAMISSGKRTSTIQTIAILMIRLKRPRVSNLKGKVIILIIGLMKKFINPRTAPAKNKVLIPG
jgi:hypothetical protein